MKRLLFFLSAHYSILPGWTEKTENQLSCPSIQSHLDKNRGLSFIDFFFAVRSEENTVVLGKAWNWPHKKECYIEGKAPWMLHLRTAILFFLNDRFHIWIWAKAISKLTKVEALFYHKGCALLSMRAVWSLAWHRGCGGTRYLDLLQVAREQEGSRGNNFLWAWLSSLFPWFSQCPFAELIREMSSWW